VEGDDYRGSFILDHQELLPEGSGATREALVLWRQYRNASGVEHTTTQYRHRTEARVQLPITLAVASVAPAAPSPNGSGGGGGSVVVEGRDQAPVREMSIPVPRQA
jgi:hypothetical protein